MYNALTYARRGLLRLYVRADSCGQRKSAHRLQ